MKNAMKYIAALLILGVVFTGCEKDPDPVSEVKDVTFPTIELKGPQAVQIPVGGTYDDEGATLTDDITGEVSDVTSTSTNLDPSTPGLYEMTYESQNANGFRTSVVRYVVVLDYTPAPDLTIDLSGPWLREATGVSAIWNKAATGLYVIQAVGGVSQTPAYIIQTSDSTVDIPVQTIFETGVGPLEMEGVAEDLNIAPGDTTVTYTLLAEGFGAAPRTFVKQ